MATPVSLEIVSGADSVTVVVVGDVDMASKDLFEEAVTQLSVEARNLVVDLRGVTFIDAMGLNMLVQIHQICAANGGTLIVSASSEPVRRLLEITKLHEVLTIDS